MRTLNKAKKVITVMLALAMVFALMPQLPGTVEKAYAVKAASVTITADDGTQNVVAETKSSEDGKWSYDADTATLTLNNWKGQQISANGDLNLHLVGTNTITMPSSTTEVVGIYIGSSGAMSDLNITADTGGTLNIKGSTERDFYGIKAYTYITNGTVNIDITSSGSDCSYGMYGNVYFTKNETSQATLKVKVTDTNTTKTGYLSAFGNVGIFVENRSNVTVNAEAHVSSANKYTCSAIGTLYIYEASPVITATADCLGEISTECIAVDNLRCLGLTEGGKLTANGAVKGYYPPEDLDAHVVTTTPADNNYLFRRGTDLGIKNDTYYYMCGTDGSILNKAVFEYSKEAADFKWVGGNYYDIPGGMVGDSISNTIYLLAGLRGADGLYDLQSKTKFEILSGSLPSGLKLYEKGGISGTVTAPCEAGTVTIKATDTNDATRTATFTINYGAFTSQRPVTDMTLDKTEIILEKNATETITATVTPEDASYPNVKAVSSNTSIASIKSVGAPSGASSTIQVSAGYNPGKATITVTSLDSSLNRTCTVYVKEPTPAASFSYYDETLRGLEAGRTYSVSGTGVTTTHFTTDADKNTYPLAEDWLGKEISLVLQNGTYGNCDSSPQTITLPARPAAPTLATQEESYDGAGDGKISGVDTNMQYRKTGETNWKDCTGSEITNLDVGSYEVRVKAIDGTQFAGNTTNVTIGTKEFTFEKPADIPEGNTTTWIDSFDLSEYVSGGKKPYTYTKVSGPAWVTLEDSTIRGQRPSSPTAAGGNEADLVLEVSDATGKKLTHTIKVGNITQKTQAAPSTPVKSGEAGKNSITIQTVSGQLYSCVPATEESAPDPGDAAWITPDGSGTHTFTGLTHNTWYKIYAMKPAQGEYSASAASEPLGVKTKEDFAQTPVPSKSSCGFKDPFTLTATSEKGATIYYTIDSTEPSKGDTKDIFPESGITIGNSSDPVGTIYTVKLKAFMDDGSKSPSETITLTYTKVDGYTVSGTVKGYNSSNAPVVSLYDAADTGHTTPIATAVVDAAVASGGQYTWNFSFAGVPDDTYDLVVTKAGHLTYTITGVKVEGSDIDLTSAAYDGKAYQLITLLAGDVNGDSLINMMDYAIILNPANFNKSYTSPSEVGNVNADLNGDNLINMMDYAIVLSPKHFNKAASACTIIF